MWPPELPFTCTDAVLLLSPAMPIVQPIGMAVVGGNVTVKNESGLLKLDSTLPLSATAAR